MKKLLLTYLRNAIFTQSSLSALALLIVAHTHYGNVDDWNSILKAVTDLLIALKFLLPDDLKTLLPGDNND